MRIERVELTGFGALRDVDIAMHPRLTLLLGDNESGKTTLHRAIRAAFFGIDAGGQGRAVERSDWARWSPWTGGPYGVALTYTLSDGRRIRVARRLDSREQPVQVLEVGGPDLTDAMRRGRAVTPGAFHLGIDEAVFCATACLGDDGLRLGGPEHPGARAASLQEAIERLADSRRGVTATQAIKRLRDALQRVGTERRSASPLGAASSKLRELDVRLEQARRQLETVAADRERLLQLDRAATDAAQRQLHAERQWLAGRIAELNSRLGKLGAVADECRELTTVIDDTRRFERFPMALEEPVISLGGEFQQASTAAAEAEARWRAAQQPLTETKRRRAEIAAGVAALEAVPGIGAATAGQATRLEGEVSALEQASAATRTDVLTNARITALRREIAGTGLGSIPATALAPLGELTRDSEVTGGRLSIVAALTGVAVAGGAATGTLFAAHRGLVVLFAAIPAAISAIAVALATVFRRRAAATARQRLEDAAERLGLTGDEVIQLKERLPSLAALHAALAQEEVLAQSRSAEADALHATAAALAQRCAVLAGSGPPPPSASPAPTTARLLHDARASLETVQAAVELHRRRAELLDEDSLLAARQQSMEALEQEARTRADGVAALGARLQQLLRTAGMQPRRTPPESVAAVREACDGRRRHESAQSRLEEVRRRAGTIGVEHEIRRSRDALLHQLQQRGGALEDGVQEPLGVDALSALERQAEHARQAAAVAGEQARELRVRLATLLASMPDVAALEDERDACAAQRDVARRQHDALVRAIELIEQASRRTHRDLAPQLADNVGARLQLVTDARYTRVNVDTEHFAIALLGRDRPDMIPLDVASHGTRDQVGLLLRLALCETLSASSEPVPLLLDEPLLTADPSRRRTMLQFLVELSTTHQVVLTAADPSVASVVRDVAGEDGMTVVTVGDTERALETTGRRAKRMRVLTAG
ncbi:MAG: AAA family ATPase [Candidatus Dormibacteria bacterium]